MGKLTYLIIHCTATPEGRELSSKSLLQMHMAAPPIGRGWKRPGYRDMIHLNGLVENLVPYNNDDIVDPWEITNGVEGLNSVAAHVVYVGGMDVDNKRAKDTRTKEQLMALRNYVTNVIAHHPHIKVAGHNQFANKACPSFDTVRWLRAVGIPEKNILKKVE